MLENLEDAVELNSMTLFYTLRNSFPEISFLDIPEGFNYVSEFFPENLKQKLIETGNRSVQGRETVYIDENTNRARAVLSSEFNFNDKGYVPGGMIIDGVNYKQGFPDFINTIYIVGKLEKEGVFYPIGVRVDENQKLYLTLLSNEEIDNFL